MLFANVYKRHKNKDKLWDFSCKNEIYSVKPLKIKLSFRENQHSYTLSGVNFSKIFYFRTVKGFLPFCKNPQTPINRCLRILAEWKIYTVQNIIGFHSASLIRNKKSVQKEVHNSL